MLSVVITTFNRVDCLEENLKHFLVQTDPHFEVIVAIDGSTDSTVDMLKRFQSSSPFPLSWLDTKKTSLYCLGEARNLGILNARGRGVVILDDDSFPTPAFIEHHQRLLRPKTLTGGYRTSHDPSDSLHEKMKKMEPLLSEGPFPLRKFSEKTGLWGPVENNCSMLREDWIACGLFTEEIKGYGGVGQEFFERLKFLGFDYQFSREAEIFHHREYEGANGLNRKKKNEMSLDSKKKLGKICSKARFLSQIRMARRKAQSVSMKIRHLASQNIPTAIHAPGYTAFFAANRTRYYQLNPSFPMILSRWKHHPFQACSFSNRLTILIINSKPSKGLAEQSLDRLSFPYRVGGQGLNPFRNRMKLSIYREMLKTVTTPYVMGLDSYDVLVTRSPDQAIETFEMMDCEMLFNCEQNFYPDCGTSLKENVPYLTQKWKAFQTEVAKTNYKYLNAGCWIGKTDFCKEFFAEAEMRTVAPFVNEGLLPDRMDSDHQKIEDSEQVIIQWMFSDFYPRVRLDYHCEIFLNLVSLCPSKDLAVFDSLAEINLRDLIPLGMFFLKRFQKKLLDTTRPLRGRLGLRHCQWQRQAGGIK